jgi:hypothetical protein
MAGKKLIERYPAISRLQKSVILQTYTDRTTDF